MSTDTDPGMVAPRRPSTRRDVSNYRDLTLDLVGRELALRQRGSILGFVWALVPPLLQFGAAYFLFTKVIPLDVDNYPAFLLVGVLAWNWFSRSLTAASESMEANRSLVFRPGFPAALLPLVRVLVGFVDYLFGVPVVLVALMLTTGLNLTALLLPVLLAIQFVLTLGIAFVLAPLQVFFRDVQPAAAVVLTLGFWLTPVFYERSAVPESFDLVYDLNPMAHMLAAQRAVLIEGTLPTARTIVALSIVSVVVLAAGYAVFARLRHAVPDRV